MLRSPPSLRPRVRAFLAFALLLAACAPDPTPLPDPLPWPGEDRRPSLDPGYFAEQGLGDLSLYAGRVEGPVDTRPDHMHRGVFAVGNGRTFGFLGLADPLNTLHSVVGPVYERDTRFFGDLALVLEVDGEPVETTTEWAARVRETAILVTRADSAEHSLYTVDFAPLPADTEPFEVPPAIVRVVLVHSRADSSREVALRLRPRRDLEVRGDLVVEAIDADERLMSLSSPDGPVELDPREDRIGARLALGTLAPGAVLRATFAFTTAQGPDALAELTASDAAFTAGLADSWLDDTLESWRAFSRSGLQLDTGDPRMNDLFDGMRVGIRAQQSAGGGVSPMSQYTLVWLRDCIGPVRFFLRAGLPDYALAALDFLHTCATVRGDISNACESGLSPGDERPPPDWDALGPFTDRQAAEGPSHLPLMYRDYVAYTGDLDPVRERWAYLRRSLLAQQIDERGRQPFSGDETYRNAMGAALGFDINYSWQDETWSADSSFLLAAAADWMADVAPEVGHAEDAEELRALADLARKALSDEFLLPDGYFAPFILRDGEVPESRPFEDVSLKPLWIGALSPSDPLALSNLDALREVADRGDGTFQSPLDSSYIGMFDSPAVYDGIHTGMVPGYVLANLSLLGAPDADAAFDALHRYADPAGQYSEYMVYDDHSAFQPLYDASGVLGDYTARFRPWEGGIDLDAFLLHLLGPLVEPGEDALLVRPRLPRGQRALRATGIRAGERRLDLDLTRDETGWRLELSSTATVAFSVAVELPIPADVDVSGSWDGEEVGEVGVRPAGERVLRFPPVEMAPGATHVAAATMD